MSNMLGARSYIEFNSRSIESICHCEERSDEATSLNGDIALRLLRRSAPRNDEIGRTLMTASPHILILAAGRGKRMHSQLPKVLHRVLFRPMIHYVLDVAKALPHQSISMIVGHGEDAVRESCSSAYPEVQFLQQREQLGTAHAVRMAEPFLSGKKGNVLILSGDVILLRRTSLEALIREHVERGAACTLTAAHIDSPRGYGRILRNSQDGVIAIREEADCSENERKINEVNAGIYCFDIESLFGALAGISDRNLQKEFYLTDTVSALVAKGKTVRAVMLADPMEMTGINDRKALARVEGMIRAEVNDGLMMSGVTLQGPESIFIDSLSRIESDVVIEAGCQISRSTIAKGVTVESGSRIHMSSIGEGSHIKQGSYIEKSEIGPGCLVGPYAHLRPASSLDRNVKIGNFVEVKNSRMAEGAKASHLSYIGDAEIGKDVNLGCGFVTCNFDGGPLKHRTIIEDGVFVGSDSQTVAPVRIGKGSYIASGTTVTKDVPPGALALSRVKQVNKDGYAAKLKKKT